MGDREGAEELAGTSENSVSSPLQHKRQGTNMASFQSEDPQSLHALASLPTSNPSLVGSHDEYAGLQGNGLSCVEKVAGKSEQFAAMSVPLSCVGPPVVI